MTQQLGLPLFDSPACTIEVGNARLLRHRLMYRTMIGETVQYGDWRITRDTNTNFTLTNTRTFEVEELKTRKHGLDVEQVDCVVAKVSAA